MLTWAVVVGLVCGRLGHGGCGGGARLGRLIRVAGSGRVKTRVEAHSAMHGNTRGNSVGPKQAKKHSRMRRRIRGNRGALIREAMTHSRKSWHILGNRGTFEKDMAHSRKPYSTQGSHETLENTMRHSRNLSRRQSLENRPISRSNVLSRSRSCLEAPVLGGLGPGLDLERSASRFTSLSLAAVDSSRGGSTGG